MIISFDNYKVTIPISNVNMDDFLITTKGDITLGANDKLTILTAPQKHLLLINSYYTFNPEFDTRTFVSIGLGNLSTFQEIFSVKVSSPRDKKILYPSMSHVAAYNILGMPVTIKANFRDPNAYIYVSLTTISDGGAFYVLTSK